MRKNIPEHIIERLEPGMRHLDDQTDPVQTSIAITLKRFVDMTIQFHYEGITEARRIREQDRKDRRDRESQPS